MTKEDRVARFSKVEKLAKDKGVTYSQITSELNMPNSLFSEWKKGKSMPKADKLVKIADYFGVDIKELL